MKTIAIVGAFPPPVHGMAKNNLLISAEISSKAKVLKVNTSGNSLQRGIKYHLTRAIRCIQSVLLIALKRPSTVYMSMDGGLGILYNTLTISSARLFAEKIVIHHRSFAYLDKRSLLARFATIVAGKNCLHVFLCQCMRDRFFSLYNRKFRSIVVSNAKHTPPLEFKKRERIIEKLFIGHLSNLSFEKGLKEVIETYEQLVEEGILNIKLILAGPVENEASEEFLKLAMLRNPKGIQYLGPVYDREKFSFYQSIDLFLFPTNYKNEAQPNVVFEALSHNVPVIATDRGCLRSDLSNTIAAAIFNRESFVSRTKQFIKEIISSPETLEARRSAAHVFISAENEKSRHDHNALIMEILHETI